MAVGQNGFDKSARLRTATDYRHVFERPVRRKNRRLSILVRHNNLGRARLGLAISKKSVPLAVDRNRVKRLIRETFRVEQARLAAVDMVVMAQRSAGDAENHDLGRALCELWRAAKIWVEAPEPRTSPGS